MNIFITPEFNHQFACVLVIQYISLTTNQISFIILQVSLYKIIRDNFTRSHSIFPRFQNVLSYIFASIWTKTVIKNLKLKTVLTKDGRLPVG